MRFIPWILSITMLSVGCAAKGSRPRDGARAGEPSGAAVANPARARVLVRVAGEGVGRATATELFKQLQDDVGGQVVAEFPDIKGWRVIELPAGLTAEQASTRFQNAFQKARPAFAAKVARDGAKADDIQLLVEEDVRIKIPDPVPGPPVQPPGRAGPAAVPNDPLFPQLWGMKKVQAPAAWDLSTGRDDIVVAVVDTGVNYNHPDLKNNMWQNQAELHGTSGEDDDKNGVVDDIRGFDSFNQDVDPMDNDGHGTHCAGTIGAAGNNGLVVPGVNWKVRILPVKFLGPADGAQSQGEPPTSTVSVWMSAYQYLIRTKRAGVNVRVASNSWVNDPTNRFSQAQKDAIDEAGGAGILSCFAAGNEGKDNDSNPTYPASYTSDSIVAVAASGPSDERAVFSSFGRSTVDLAAPGVGIISTYINSNGFASLGGTSMACPHVAGAAALYIARATDQGQAADGYKPVKEKLLTSVDKLANWGGLVSTGGRLNLVKLLGPSAAPAKTSESQ